jgi:hypothetical protein
LEGYYPLLDEVMRYVRLASELSDLLTSDMHWKIGKAFVACEEKHGWTWEEVDDAHSHLVKELEFAFPDLEDASNILYGARTFYRAK